MSWSEFKNNIENRMDNSYFKDLDSFVTFFVNEYDTAVKSGKDFVTLNSVRKGNKELMKETISAGLSAGVFAKEEFYNKLMTIFGNGVKAYWGTAELQKISVPLTPAPGTLANLQTKSNLVTNPGQFESAELTPNPNNKMYLFDTFVNYADAHLSTISGVTETLSQYPPPASPNIGIVQWTGYKVPKGNTITASSIKWDEIFNYGKLYLIRDLKKENIGIDLINLALLKGTKLEKSLYNLKDLVIKDAKNGDKISSSTKEYFQNVILPAFLSTIDDVWSNINFIKKSVFRTLRQKKQLQIKGVIQSSLIILFVRMNEKASELYTDLDTDEIKQNILYIINDLDTYISSDESGFGSSALKKIMTL